MVVWVFDLDDTLMRTTELYARKIKKAYYFICRHHLREHAPTLSQFQQKQREIDSDLRRRINPITKKPYFYAMERFPLSLVETYEYFCQQANLKFCHEVADELKRIGNEVYLSAKQYRKKFKPEIGNLLPFLKNKGDVLVLLTKGDRRVQIRKIRALRQLGLLRCFTAYYIVRDKNREIFRRIRRRFKTATAFFSVGNEYPSDIEPAIKAGFFGVYIPIAEAAVWEKGKLEKIEEDRDKENSNRYDNLLEIKRKYDYLRRETMV
jgi:putative hydrolase of the HAD superfamily